MTGKANDLCEVCNKAEYTILCDYRNGTGIVTSVDFQELTQTCDKKICNKCAFTLWINCDVCPEHAEKIKNRLLPQAPDTTESARAVKNVSGGTNHDL